MKWLLAELLLRRTTRVAAQRVFTEFTANYPSLRHITEASEDELSQILAPLGLVKQRTSQLKKLALVLQREYGGDIPCTKAELLKLPGIGDYAADSVLLYACGKNAFPIDGGIQRVLRRVAGLPTSRGSKKIRSTRRVRFNKDPWIAHAKDYLLKAVPDISELRFVHRGLLLVAWETCRARAVCTKCVLFSNCSYAMEGNYRPKSFVKTCGNQL